MDIREFTELSIDFGPGYEELKSRAEKDALAKVVNAGWRRGFDFAGKLLVIPSIARLSNTPFYTAFLKEWSGHLEVLRLLPNAATASTRPCFTDFVTSTVDVANNEWLVHVRRPLASTAWAGVTITPNTGYSLLAGCDSSEIVEKVLNLFQHETATSEIQFFLSDDYLNIILSSYNYESSLAIQLKR